MGILGFWGFGVLENHFFEWLIYGFNFCWGFYFLYLESFSGSGSFGDRGNIGDEGAVDGFIMVVEEWVDFFLSVNNVIIMCMIGVLMNFFKDYE